MTTPSWLRLAGESLEPLRLVLPIFHCPWLACGPDEEGSDLFLFLGVLEAGREGCWTWDLRSTDSARLLSLRLAYSTVRLNDIVVFGKLAP